MVSDMQLSLAGDHMERSHYALLGHGVITRVQLCFVASAGKRSVGQSVSRSIGLIDASGQLNIYLYSVLTRY